MSFFQTYYKKIKFSSQNIIVLTDIVSFITISNETGLLNCFVYIAKVKNHCEIKLRQFKNDKKCLPKQIKKYK